MIFFKKSKKNQNTEETVVNALPKYTIKTMPDDLAKLGLGKPQKEKEKEEKIEIKKKTIEPPKALPIVEPIKRTPLPKAEEFIASIPKPIISEPIIPRPITTITPKSIIPETVISEPVIFKPISPIIPEPIIPKPIISKPIEKPATPKIASLRLVSPGLKKPKKKIKIKISKKFIIGLIIILIAIAISAFFYWQGQRPEPLPQPKPENIQPEQSLIIINETKILKLLPGQQLVDLIKEEIIKDQETKTLKRLAILKNDTEFLSLMEIIKELNITIAPYALSELKNNYTLVVYAQNDKRHLGIITEIENESNLKDQLRFWEKTMGDNLQNLFIIEKPESPTTTNFQDNVYKNIAIRYVNFPKPELTIDYAVSNDLFILTTSKEAIYKIIDNFN